MLIFRYSTYFKKIEKNSDAAQHTSLSSITKNIFDSQGAKGFFVGKLFSICTIGSTQYLIFNLHFVCINSLIKQKEK